MSEMVSDAHDYQTKIGAVLQSRRVELGLSQEQVALAIQKARSTVSHLENGKHEYNYGLLREIAKALKFDMFQLALMFEVPDCTNDPVISKAVETIHDRIMFLTSR